MIAKLVPSRRLAALCVCCLVAFVLVAPDSGWAQQDCYAIIQVAPGTMNLARTGEGVTIHVNVPFSYVDQDLVFLYINEDEENGISPVYCYPDDRGDFVAKFLMADVAALRDPGILLVPDENWFWLEGEMFSGESFCGGDLIVVVDGGRQSGGGK